jgi:hypothetical protein
MRHKTAFAFFPIALVSFAISAQDKANSKSEPADAGVVSQTAMEIGDSGKHSSDCWPDAKKDIKAKKAGFVQSMAKISPDSPVGVFKTGESAFTTIVLPEFKKAYRFEVSLVFDLNFRKQSEVLVPSLVFLDGDYCEIATYSELDFEPVYGAFSGTQIEKAFIPVNDSNPKYVLIFTDPMFNETEVNVTTDFGYGMESTSRFLRVAYGYVNVRINK